MTRDGEPGAQDLPQTGDYPVMRYDDKGQFIGDPEQAATGEPPPAESEAMRRFRASMVMDYEKWHDGIGYDLATLAEMSAGERHEVEVLILSGGIADWRDVEALAALDSETARTALHRAGQSGPLTVRLAVAHRVPELLDDAEKTACIVEALRTATWFDGLRKAIDRAEVFHPPEVIAALWEGLERRSGDAAVHFAALLCHLHGLASSPFDRALRPLFLSFNTVDAGARRAAIAELRRRIQEAQR
ncbi:hypothetical protein [Methylococcus mesophilus]|uniref:hypothetical protein n=1 Tax=Methylococcus mesophilus TaxID=2993564 RepID=UPI00224B50DC|nr:hypothetical protein [Methylococcus mesophilus]UZR27219.1 hypothetical protein OOT43_10775 [Methylococcus mesophilus]